MKFSKISIAMVAIGLVSIERCLCAAETEAAKPDPVAKSDNNADIIVCLVNSGFTPSTDSRKKAPAPVEKKATAQNPSKDGDEKEGDDGKKTDDEAAPAEPEPKEKEQPLGGTIAAQICFRTDINVDEVLKKINSSRSAAMKQFVGEEHYIDSANFSLVITEKPAKESSESSKSIKVIGLTISDKSNYMEKRRKKEDLSDIIMTLVLSEDDHKEIIGICKDSSTEKEYHIHANNITVPTSKNGSSSNSGCVYEPRELYSERRNLTDFVKHIKNDSADSSDDQGFLAKYWVVILVGSIITVAICCVVGYLVSNKDRN
ncbi:uncharacterized protein NEMAJ01_0937 [Nematocida major]|uniref:uncharacterized protein n=1 Tax=Nematocida major TaxID=1912982 RepID=UPI0020080338|nr:uncharacterized protein NEMAJ01_0937 [Nematocida major]KAH9386041.1 hypothetical protein NEMAJ01_0937 [Nematocida major]